MTLKVRDEEDILDANLRYHLAQGVDYFIVTDNGSTDGTPQILRSYQQAGLLHLIEESDQPRTEGSDELAQTRGTTRAITSRWVTRMARLAATEHGADWVINNDADEFWWPLGTTLKDAFASVPDRYGVLTAPRTNFMGRPDTPGPFFERLIYRQAHSTLQPKVAHRAHPDVFVVGGAHKVTIRSPADPSDRASSDGERAMSGPLAMGRDDPDVRLLSAPWWPVRILHFPVRSFEQYKRRVEIHLFHSWSHRPRGAEWDVRRHYEQGRLHELYERLLLDDDAIEAGLRQGTLVRDHGLRDFLAGCPDPLTQGVDATRRWGESAMRLAPEREAAERFANEWDMVQSLARIDLSLRRKRRESRHEADGLRRRNREMAAERKRLRRRVRELEQASRAVTRPPRRTSVWRRAWTAAARKARRD